MRGYRSEKNNMITTPILGIAAGIVSCIIIFYIPVINNNLKLIFSILLGASLGFLLSLVLYLNDKLNKFLIHDELTGLYNKNFLAECKYRVMSHADRQQGKMGVVIVEIDRLNDIISKNGFKAGEAVLRFVGEGLVTTSRASEFIFRIDEDNFLILFENINEYNNIKVIKNRLQNHFINPLYFQDKTIEIKLNFGYAVYPEDGDDFEKVFNVSKQRLYVNKSR